MLAQKLRREAARGKGEDGSECCYAPKWTCCSVEVLNESADALEAKDGEIKELRTALDDAGYPLGEIDGLRAEIAKLRAALDECGAKYVPPPCATVAEGLAYIVIEFKRRMEIAAAALEQRMPQETK